MLRPLSFDIEKQNTEIEAAQVRFDRNNTTKTVFLCINSDLGFEYKVALVLLVNMMMDKPHRGNRHNCFKLLSIILAACTL
jgi:hypothetical protein